ncbi:MAG: hypothetical protein IKP28_05750 [Clostridia bacterium]|nr:hypothetical protein [Clostridia bacterium]
MTTLVLTERRRIQKEAEKRELELFTASFESEIEKAMKLARESGRDTDVLFVTWNGAVPKKALRMLRKAGWKVDPDQDSWHLQDRIAIIAR